MESFQARARGPGQEHRLIFAAQPSSDWLRVDRLFGEKFFHAQSSIFLPMTPTPSVLFATLEFEDDDLTLSPLLDNAAHSAHSLQMGLPDADGLPLGQREHGKLDHCPHLHRQRRNTNERSFSHPILFSSGFDHSVSHTRPCLRLGFIASQQL